MWWIAFTAIDLYIGLVVLEAMLPSLPPEKLSRAKAARNFVVVSLLVSVVAFLGVLLKHWFGKP